MWLRIHKSVEHRGIPASGGMRRILSGGVAFAFLASVFLDAGAGFGSGAGSVSGIAF